MANNNTIITIGFDYDVARASRNLDSAMNQLQRRARNINVNMNATGVQQVNRQLGSTHNLLGNIQNSLVHNIVKMGNKTPRM